MKRNETDAAQPWVLQLCHGYDGPFLDCARQYAALFHGSPYKVCTVYLTGEPCDEARLGSGSDEVVFLEQSSRDIRGLKLQARAKLRSIVSARGFRFCIAHRFKSIFIALIATRLPVIGVNHAFGVYNRFTRRLFANVYRKRLLLLGVSNAVRDDIRAHLPGWEATRIETLYNRIDVEAVQAEQLSRNAARSFLGLPEQGWVVGNVGRLHPDKDQETLIRAFAFALPQLPTSSLLAIMGSGRLEQNLRQLAKDLGVSDKVCFLGQLTNGRRYFKAFDVFALTSDHEPFGMVLLEAMAAGVPLIGSDCGGGREVIDGAGRLFRYGDSKALANELVALAKSDITAQCVDYYVQLEKFSDKAARARFEELTSMFLNGATQ
jgi:glycosyltransferase involved in cell wall biosynthesis